MLAGERIAALVIGAMAIGFGLMLLPVADALRRKMQSKREPPPIGELRLIHGLDRTWRNHVVPWAFVLSGALLVALAILGG